jgi:hypothetical protein
MPKGGKGGMPKAGKGGMPKGMGGSVERDVEMADDCAVEQKYVAKTTGNAHLQYSAELVLQPHEFFGANSSLAVITSRRRRATSTRSSGLLGVHRLYSRFLCVQVFDLELM